MIITLDADAQTYISMNSLVTRYGNTEGVRAYIDMRRNKSCNLRRTEDILPGEHEIIDRITFLGHADTHNEFSSFLSPEEFVDFLERVFNETGQDFLDQLETIDLFGCEVGRNKHSISFAKEVTRILSERGYTLEIRAFSHEVDATIDYGRTLLREENGEWSYLGLNPSQTEQYIQFKKEEKGISKQINKLASSKAKYNNIINGTDVKPQQLEDARHQLSTADAQIDELKLQLHPITNQINILLSSSTVIIPPTSTPRETLDGLDYCCFHASPLSLEAQAGTTLSSTSVHENEASQVKEEKSSISIVEPKNTSGVSHQEMKESMATVRAKGQQAEKSRNQNTSSVPGFSPGGDSDDK